MSILKVMMLVLFQLCTSMMTCKPLTHLLQTHTHIHSSASFSCSFPLFLPPAAPPTTPVIGGQKGQGVMSANSAHWSTAAVQFQTNIHIQSLSAPTAIIILTPASIHI